MADKMMIGFLLAVCIAAVQGEWCTDHNYVGDDTRFYCSTSCCGEYYNRYCCGVIEVGAIVGIVLGSLALAAIVVSVVVCVCCCKRSRGQQGQVVGGTGVVNMGATTVTTAHTQPYVVNAGYPQPMVQGYPAGNQFAHPPPSYPATQANV